VVGGATDAVAPTKSAVHMLFSFELMHSSYLWGVVAGEATDALAPTTSAVHMLLLFQ